MDKLQSALKKLDLADRARRAPQRALKSFKGLPQYVRTRECQSILKATIAYEVAFILAFSTPFWRLFGQPLAITTLIIPVIAGQPGRSVGAVIDQAILGSIGVCLGGLIFLVLSVIDSRVGKGFVFAAIVFALSLVKARGLRFFGFSLLAILVGFIGIYASVLQGGLETVWLISYVQGYLIGFAIVIVVNILILPVSSERELREMLVQSLEHAATFAHLISKTYTLEITQEEKKARDGLHQSIRADLFFLKEKLDMTGWEVNWTRWSLGDYKQMVGHIRGMQQGLITSYSGLVTLEAFDPDSLRIITQELRGAERAFPRLRRGADLVIGDIVANLTVGKHHKEAPQRHSPAGDFSWEDFLDDDLSFDDDERSESTSLETRVDEKEPSREDDIESGVPQPQRGQERGQLRTISERLRREVERAEQMRSPSASPSRSRRGSGSHLPQPQLPTSLPHRVFDGPSRRDSPQQTPEGSEAAGPVREKRTIQDKVGWFLRSWEDFKHKQNAHMIRLVSTGTLADNTLHLEQPGPSIEEVYGAATGAYAKKVSPKTFYEPGAASQPQGQAPQGLRRRRHTHTSVSPDSDSEEEDEDDEGGQKESPEDAARNAPERACGAVSMRILTYEYGMSGLVESLAALHRLVVPPQGEEPRRKRLHAHFYEALTSITPFWRRKGEKSLGLKEALAMLHGHKYTPPKRYLWERVMEFEHLLRGDTAVYAAKTMAAVTVFTVLILAPSLTDFFVEYSLTAGSLTIVVAMAPTLGQSIVTFVLQILGTGFGSIFGVILLEIFKDLGGYAYNPYAICCLLLPYGWVLSWVIYTKPVFFAGALLAMNGAGVIILTLWNYDEMGVQSSFGTPPSPALRLGDALVAMCVALGIAGIFQMFILRRPARHKLRQSVTKVMFALSSYNMLLQELTNTVAPLAPKSSALARAAPPPEAVAAVRKELMRRETEIQLAILGTTPLMRFANAEPKMGIPFKGRTISRIIRSQQMILDRLREARSSLGMQSFSQRIKDDFTHKLYPYRRQARRFTKAVFYLCACSLATKKPLPSELPSALLTARGLQHDALVLTHRMAEDEEGRALIESEGFLRWWFYLMSMTSVAFHLHNIEDDIRDLWGRVSDCHEHE